MEFHVLSFEGPHVAETSHSQDQRPYRMTLRYHEGAAGVGGKHKRGLEGMLEQCLADMQRAHAREPDSRRQHS
jgi:hypothetical protein